MVSTKTKALFGLILIIALFVLTSYFVKQNIDIFKELIGNSQLGLLIWFLFTVIAVVIAPITNMFLMPLVSNVYGWIETAIVTLAAWSIGSFIVFYLCRKYGVNLVKKLVSLNHIYKIESRIPKENMFLNLLFLRMIVPVELLSYAVGLFSKVNFRTYAITTVLGLIPIAFLFSYIGVISLQYQILGGITIILLIILIHLLRELWGISKKKI
ncbi:VTT domain-containing protein [Candidatus Gottesmanbacteria bacterium]|nr:VTT domain-containing protein [Candidatus Gottesmanbacteria bacterium]